MNESIILRTACDAEWYAHAYSEYLADVAQTTSNFMSAIQEMLGRDQVNADVIFEILTTHGISPSARFILGEIGTKTAFNIMNEAWTQLDSDDPQLDNSNYTTEELFSTIRGTWTQCVISAKAFEAYAQQSTDNVTRVTKFLQDVQANFQIDDTVRNTISYYQSMLNASPTVDDFIKQFTYDAGIDNAEGSNDPASYMNSNIYAYTGSTPGIALDFSTVNKAVTATVSVAATAIKGVFSAVGRGISWLFNKAKKYVVDTVVDPAVCEYVGSDDNNEGYIDGFAWFGEFIPNATHSWFETGAQVSQVFSGFYDEYAEKWIKIKLKVGEFLFRIISNDIKWQCYFKPVAVDVDYFSSMYTGDTENPWFDTANVFQSIADFNSWLQGVMEYIRPVSKDATKEQIYRGLAFGTSLTKLIAEWAFVETAYIVNDFQIPSFDGSVSRMYPDLSEYYSYEPVLENEGVTNKKILEAAAGKPNLLNNIEYHLSYDTTLGVRIRDGSYIDSMRATMTHIIAVWAMCRTQRKLYPLNYTFVPYSNNHTSFSSPSWRIKSDNDIANTRDNFIELAITAVVIIAVVVFIGITATKISKRNFFKRQQTLGQLENKMWNGGKLTSAERRKYIKYNRKQNASKWLSSGVNEPSSSLSNDNQSIITLIQG